MSEDAFEYLPAPELGTKVTRKHGPEEQRGQVTGIVLDPVMPGGYVVVMRFWFKHRQRWHIEAIDGFSWSYRMGDDKRTIGLQSGAIGIIAP